MYQVAICVASFAHTAFRPAPRALTMSNDYEIAGPTREDMIYESTRFSFPSLKVCSTRRIRWWRGRPTPDYYQAAITGPTQAQIDWVKENQPDDRRLPRHLES